MDANAKLFQMLEEARKFAKVNDLAFKVSPYDETKIYAIPNKSEFWNGSSCDINDYAISEEGTVWNDSACATDYDEVEWNSSSCSPEDYE